MAMFSSSVTKVFQFTRPQGARHSQKSPNFFTASFNSRARKGRDSQHPAIYTLVGVSIHAPARGATRSKQVVSLSCAVSIHAPARGATGRALVKFLTNKSFNSRARKGRDPPKTPPICTRSVSIHAPARGATPGPLQQWPPGNVSIHAPARGATRVYHSVCQLSTFQFTRPQGARRGVLEAVWPCLRFNSRARKGRDPVPATSANHSGRFNSRARKGRDGLPRLARPGR